MGDLSFIGLVKLAFEELVVRDGVYDVLGEVNLAQIVTANIEPRYT